MTCRIKLLMLSILAVSLSACGSDKAGNSSQQGSVAASASCFSSSHAGSCHQSSLSPGSGLPIVTEWQQSIHYTSNVAGCIDCHERDSNHYCSTCHGGSVQSSAHAKPCYICHDGANTVKPLDGKHLSATPENLDLTAPLPDSTYSAGYAVLRGTPYESDCRWCHNPHNNSVTEKHREWSESGHGEVNAEPYIHYDFKVRGADNASPQTSAPTDCVRCHTSTGYINFINSGFNDVRPWGAKRGADGKPVVAGGGTVPISNQKQVIYCNVCHDNGNGSAYGYKMRKVPQVTGYYNYNITATIPADPRLIINSVTFPDVATSNICLPCHAGREAGSTIKKVFAAITSAKQYDKLSFINSHYLTAGGTVFKTTGYEYANREYVKATDQYKHDQIGRNNTSGTGIDGPCVTCHLRPGRHSFLPVLRGDYVTSSPLVDKFGAVYMNPMNQSVAAIESPVCNSVCHIQTPWTAASLEERKNGYRHALKVFQNIVESSVNFAGRIPQFIASNNPYFFNMSSNGTKPENYSKTSTASANAFKKWGNEGNMGAAFNLNLLFRDYGSFAHNDLYAKRLIFDSIDWLDGGADFSAGTTINGIDPVAWTYINPHPSASAPYGDNRDRP